MTADGSNEEDRPLAGQWIFDNEQSGLSTNFVAGHL
jgi:hypothetical protein